MSDESRSMILKPKKTRPRILVVNNPGPDSDDENHGPHPTSSNPSQKQLPPATQYAPPYGPDLVKCPSEYSNPSNPTLSSPSSTSSPACESTPPPSTPGQSNPTLDFAGDGTLRQEPVLAPYPDSNETSPQATHTYYPTGLFPRMISRHGQRVSANRPATSPTTSIPESQPPQNGAGRPSPSERITLLVTTDVEHLVVVDIVGARDAAYIRERIFAKLQISDDDQPRFSIYRTEIGKFAIGDALSDEQLWDLYCERGDEMGSVKLLVSHSHAPVHEASHDSGQASPVNTIPPPVLPRNGLYPPLHPVRPSRSRRGSFSSASERQPPDVDYEASGSEDPDPPDREPRRGMRAVCLPGFGRPQSPVGTLDRTRAQVFPEGSGRTRGGVLPTPPSQHNSPELIRPRDPPLAPVPPHWHKRSPSDVATERERGIQISDNQSDLAQPKRTFKEREEREEKLRRRDQVKKERPRPSHRDIREGWTVVPVDVPKSGYRPITPQDSRPSPRHGPTSALSLPQQPRVPPPPPPIVGPNEPRNRKRQGQPVPNSFVITWKGPGAPGKPEPTPAPAPRSPPGPSWSRLFGGAKSMHDLRGSYVTQAPAGGSGGRSRPPASPLPVSTRPGTGTSNSSVPFNGTALNSNGNMDPPSGYSEASSMSEMGFPKSYEGPRGPLASPIRPSPVYHTNQPVGSIYPGSAPSNPSREFYHLPPSSTGSDLANLTNRTNRNPQSPHHTEQPPTVSSPYSGSVQTSLPIREDVSGPTMSFGPRPLPSHPRYDRPLADPSVLDHTAAARVPSRSPINNKSPAFETNQMDQRMEVLPVQRTLSSLPVREDDSETLSSSENTVRRDDYFRWQSLLQKNDGPGSSTAIPPPRAPSVEYQPDSDEESDGGTLWAKPPPKASRPVLTPIDTDSSPSSRHSPLPQENPRVPPPNFPAPPGYIPEPPPPPRRTVRPNNSGSGKNLQDQRTSRFDNNFDYTWAPRPPPEEVFESLQEYFPEHDVDEPVIDASSGGASPTSAEPNPLPQTDRKFKHKKSIRVVAAEHKRRIDRTSRMEPNVNNHTILRKRNTKLWGSRLEEVTTAHAQQDASTSAESSPGTAKPIFRWVRGELIGKGTYGKVYLALNATTGEMIAVKQVEIPRTASDKDDSRQVSVVEALKLESETLKDLDHPHIVQYLGFEETPTFLSIFLEYVPGGSIASCLRKHGKFDEEVTKSFTGQILSGLEYLHSKGILHRDMKADNILVETSGICKISDFGISKRTDDINMAGVYTSMQGTVFWMAPEVIDANKQGYNSKIDIWSVGCVVFEMWTGQRPWMGKEAMAVLLQLYQTRQGPPVPQDVALSPLADDFRQKCFATKPDERPTASELRKHPYLELQPDWTFVGFK